MAGTKKRALKPETVAKRIVAALDELKGIRPVVLDVAERTALADRFVIVSGRSHTHVQALFAGLYRAMKKAGIRLYHSEGESTGQWILADYGSVVVHIFEHEARDRYALEELWTTAETPSDSR